MPWFHFNKKREEHYQKSANAARIGQMIDEPLAWATQFVTSRNLLGARDKALAGLAFIQARRNDPRFYLAVIGEFNSGKSTLINALIGDNLLPVGAVPVTTSPTRMLYGKRMDMEVTTRDAGRLRLRSDKKRLIQWIGSMRPQITPSGDQTRDIITAITADATVARAVTGCVIEHPGTFLRGGVVIIDTPGLNDNDDLAAATIQVLQDDADLCIITIPAAFAGQLTLIEFLRERLSPMLHRCVFLITKMDTLDDATEQQRVLAQITRKLEQLGLQRPIVYPVAAQPTTNALSKKSPKPLDPYWSGQFEQLKRILADRLQEDRVIAVIERLIRLLASLLKDIDGAIAAQARSVTKQQELIRQATIADLDAFVRQERAAAAQELDEAHANAQRTLRAKIVQAQSDATNEIHSAVMGATSADALKAVAETQVTAILNRYGQQIATTHQQCSGQIDQASIAAGKVFGLHFDEAFARLRALAGAPSIQGARSVTTTTRFNAANAAGSALVEHNNAEARASFAIGGGAAAGAALGTILLPGIGTVLGAILGGIFGSLFGPSLDTRKNEMWTKLQPHIPLQFDAWRMTCVNELAALRKLRGDESDRLINEYANQYRGAYQQVLAQQQRERQRLEAVMAALDRDRVEVNTRREALERQLAEVKAQVAMPVALPSA